MIFLITAYEFGKNINPEIHDEFALKKTYNIVYASNVLNVQSGFAMARKTIKQIFNVVKKDGKFFANFPTSPRKSDIKTKEMLQLLLEQFNTVINVGGSSSAPLWMCEK